MNFMYDYNVLIHVCIIAMLIGVIIALFFFAWSIWNAGAPERKAKKRAKMQKSFWIVSRYKPEFQLNRAYFGIDFYDAKHRDRYKIYYFASAHEAFFATKEYQDSEYYDVELLSYREFQDRWIGDDIPSLEVQTNE